MAAPKNEAAGQSPFEGHGSGDVDESIPREEKARTGSGRPPCSVRVPLTPCNCSRRFHLSFCRDGEDTSTLMQRLLNGTGTGHQSTCSQLAALRGSHQKVFSVAVFDTFPSDYYGGLQRVLRQATELYPGWVVRVYHHLGTADVEQTNYMCSLLCDHDNVDLCFAPKLPGVGDIGSIAASMWRFAVMGDPLVDHYVVRDVDSPIVQREVDAVEQWIQSDKCYHIMRDTPAHETAIMAGMWGGCNHLPPSSSEQQLLLSRHLRDRMFAISRKLPMQFKHLDQVCLRDIVMPAIAGKYLAHASFFCQGEFGPTIPFPSQRENGTFVGMRTLRHEFSGDSMKQPCPLACRPQHHLDWEYC